MNQPYPPQQQAPASGSNAAVIVLVVVGILVVVVGMFAALAIYGVRKYLANAKSAEARNAIGMIAREAAEAYERDGKLCPSASTPVPANESFVSAKKYQSSPSDWSVDQAKNAGFACLRFEMAAPQYYQYEYRSTPTSFTVTARGDLNGNHVFSQFVVTGVVKDGHVVVAPTIMETNPEE